MNSRVPCPKSCGCWEVSETIIQGLRFAVVDASFRNWFFMIIVEDRRLKGFEPQLDGDNPGCSCGRGRMDIPELLTLGDKHMVNPRKQPCNHQQHQAPEYLQPHDHLRLSSFPNNSRMVIVCSASAVLSSTRASEDVLTSSIN